MNFLFKLSRPRFWIYLLGPYLVGVIAASQALTYDNQFIFWSFFLYFLFPANLLIYGVNDLFDQDTDAFNSKKGTYEVKYTKSKNTTFLLSLLVANLPFSILAAFQNQNAQIFFLIFLILGVFYSAKPIRAKAIPFLDASFNFLYAAPGYFAYFLFEGQTISIPILIASFIWCFAMHAYSAVPDIEADKKANLKTVATTLGSTLTLILCGLFYITSGILTLPYLGWLSILGIILYSAMILASFKTEIFKVYKFFPILNALFGLGLFWYIAITKFFL